MGVSMSAVVGKGNSASRADQNEAKSPAKLELVGNEPTMEQVRELLFGQTQRSNEKRAQELDGIIQALRREMIEKFAAAESRMDEMAHETARRHATTVDAIGTAISDLGAQVRKLVEPPRGK